MQATSVLGPGSETACWDVVCVALLCDIKTGEEEGCEVQAAEPFTEGRRLAAGSLIVLHQHRCERRPEMARRLAPGRLPCSVALAVNALSTPLIRRNLVGMLHSILPASTRGQSLLKPVRVSNRLFPILSPWRLCNLAPTERPTQDI